MNFAVMGITGQVGSVAAQTLLGAGHKVRAIVRSRDKGSAWTAHGGEVAIAEAGDAAAMQRAFTAVDGAFVMLPPSFAPAPGFPEVRALVAALHQALGAARPKKIVCLSTIGAQSTRPNLLGQLRIMEQDFQTLPMPVTFLRPGWFLENAAGDIASARQNGVIPSYLQPIDKRFPMIATADVGRIAAELLQEDWQGQRVVEAEGPQRVSPSELAAGLARLLGRPVVAKAVPRAQWEAQFQSQGTADPTPRIQMLDGFNEGWIDFAHGDQDVMKGVVPLDAVLKELLARSA